MDSYSIGSKITMKLFYNNLGRREKIIFLGTDLLLAMIWTMGMQLSFCGSVWGTPGENYIKPLDHMTVVHFILLFILNGLLLLLLIFFNNLYQRYHRKKAETDISVPFIKRNRLFYAFSLFCIMAAWLPYVLAYFPGGVYVDTFSSIGSAYDMDTHGMTLLNNHHPILYTLLWRAVILIGRFFHHSLFFSSGLFLIIQYIVMASVLAYMILWIKKRNLNIYITLALLVFVMFFPLFPLYAISLWKDTPFSIALLLFTLCTADIIFEKTYDCLKDPRFLMRFFFLGLLVAFTRNNGKYIVFLVVAILFLSKIRKIFSYKGMAASFCILAAFISIIQGPVYDKLNYNIDTVTESLGIPLQQLCYLVYYDYTLTEEEIDYLESIVSVESIKEQYRPCIFDSVKWYAPDFKQDTIQKDPALFLKNYLTIISKHPVGGIKAYLLATAGFWAPNISGVEGYAQTWMWENEYGLKGIDYLERFLGFSIQELITQMKPVSSGIFFLFLIYTEFILLMNRDYRKGILLLPAAANWLTVMAATPIANSLRYVYIFVLLIPLEIMLVCTSYKKYQTEGNKIE